VGAQAAESILARRPAELPPPLLMGGPSLLRWALKLQKAGELVEAAGVGRLTPSILRWWFRRLRGYEFDTTSALSDIERLTAGVPLLVEVFDRLLHTYHDPGHTVSTAEFQRVLNWYDGEVEAAFGKLMGVDQAFALEPREVELLLMIMTVSRENGYDVKDMAAALVTEWEYYQELCPVPAFNPAVDMQSLEVVQMLGLLPTRQGARPLGRLSVVGPEDPLWRAQTILRAPR
jgi:hypothetical protein